METEQTVSLAAIGTRMRARGNAEGMTLIEIMIVVAIMAMISGAVAFGFNQLARARIKTTQNAVRVVAAAAQLYRDDNPDSCPTIDQLVSARQLESNTKRTDEWGHQFSINCEGDGVTVISPGPDGQAGSGDDVSSATVAGGGAGNVQGH